MFPLKVTHVQLGAPAQLSVLTGHENHLCPSFIYPTTFSIQDVPQFCLRAPT